MSTSPWPLASLLLATTSAFVGWTVGHGAPAPEAALVAAPEPATSVAETPAPAPVADVPPATDPSTWPLKVPDLADVPQTPLGDSIRRGHEIVTHTRQALPDNVRAANHCSSCHLQAGTVADAGPWVGVAGLFPMYRSRTGTVVTLEDRVNDCFERSMNGTALPPGSAPMKDILAYMTWLSEGVPVGAAVEGRGFRKVADPPVPDAAHGAEVFATKCAACHGVAGAGLSGPDGTPIYPPLWGDEAFNIAAGMARLDTAAAFVRWNMPLGQGGTLTDQEAYDLAAYFTVQPRPDFARKDQDWPNGGKPRDARY
ncbi:MAG: c-type cytochrome [Myxococcota bacterium]